MRIEQTRSGLVARLRARRAEIEAATLTRVEAFSDPSEGADPEYGDGLRAAVSVALDYGIEALERSEDRPAPIPTALLAQARLAARHGVKLETVLRRYLAGYTLLGDFMIEEAVIGRSANSASLKGLLRIQSAVLDRLIAAVSEEYARELRSRPGSAEQRRAERVKRLLAGELLDVSEFAYDFDGWHLGVAACGDGASEAIEELAGLLGSRLLMVRREAGTLWAWLGCGRRFDRDQFQSLAARPLPIGVWVALGEPGEGLAGWRLTHHQALAALAVGQRRGGQGMVRYAEVALLASMLRDELLVTSLRELYLDPLQSERDGGVAARETLAAYFAADRNVSSAAAILAVSRRTVSNRLRAIEERLEAPLLVSTIEMEAALRLDELHQSAEPVPAHIENRTPPVLHT
jgi:hypothetical protein